MNLLLLNSIIYSSPQTVLVYSFDVYCLLINFDVFILELNISTEGVFGHYLFAFKAFVHSYQLIFEQVMLNVLLNHLDHMREKKKKGHGEINPAIGFPMCNQVERAFYLENST